MKKATFVVGALLFVMLTSFGVRGEENKKDAGEWTATVGCAKCNFAKETEAKECGVAAKVGDKTFVLKGDAVAKAFPKGCAKDGGEYVVKGKITADGKAIEVADISKKEKK